MNGTRRRASPVALLLAGLLGGAAMAGCTAPRPIAEAPDEQAPAADLRAEAERVFRLQNQVMQDLIVHGEMAAETDEPLQQAERKLASNCRYLNESAALHAGGEEPPLALKLSVLDSIGACESAASDALRLLNGDDAELATRSER